MPSPAPTPEAIAPPAAAGRGHRLGRLELGVAPEVAHDPHRGALVERRLDRRRQADVLDVELGDGEPVGRHGLGDAGRHQLAQFARVGRHVEHRDARLREVRETSCTMMLRIWKLISSLVNSPSVPTISRRKRPGSATRTA
jgi:hypothetical protein